jgi:hypothetical protein
MPSNLKMEGSDEKEQNISVGNGRFEYILSVARQYPFINDYLSICG